MTHVELKILIRDRKNLMIMIINLFQTPGTRKNKKSRKSGENWSTHVLPESKAQSAEIERERERGKKRRDALTQPERKSKIEATDHQPG